MLYGLWALFLGWLFGLIGLDTLLHNLTGLPQQGYYVCWFLTGVAIWIEELVRRK